MRKPPNPVIFGFACFGLYASLRHGQATGAAVYGMIVGAGIPWFLTRLGEALLNRKESDR